MEQAPLHLEISTAPETGVAHWIEADDGVRLRIGCWSPSNESKGTVLFFPGRGDYIELYGPALSDLVHAGFAALVIDWRGHGLSGRVAKNPKVGHVEDFSDYQLDVQAMVRGAQELNLPKPWTLIAHSMGACIGLRALIDGLDVKAAALSAPMLEIHMASYERIAAWPLTWVMKTIGKGQTYAPGFNHDSYVFRNAFEGNTLTNSREHYERWRMQGSTVPELHTGGPSMSWLLAALKETRALSKLPSPAMPCLAFCGDQDVTIGVRAIEDRMSHWNAGEMVSVPNGKHELFLETDDVRKGVMDKTIRFLEKHAM